MKQSVVFFGSGPVAAESLRLLLEHQAVEAIITKPTTATEMSAVAGSIPVQTVTNRKELDELVNTRSFNSTMGVLIDFGIIVSQAVIDYFPLGIINSHFSVLPEWRGADPISFAILSGQEKTGVSLMILTAGMDEGPLVGYGECELDGSETTPDLTQRLIHLGDGLLRHELPLRFTDKKDFKGVPQTITGRTESYSRKLTKEDGIIDWNKPAAVIEREIRAFIEWPKSRTTLGGKDVIITKAYAVPSQPMNAEPGDIDIVEQSKAFGIVTGKGTLWIDELKPAGKKEMPAKAFLAGYRQFLEK